MFNIGPALRGGDSFWSNVVLLLQDGYAIDRSSAATVVTPTGVTTGSTEQMDGALRTIKIIDVNTGTQAVLCSIPALGTSDWTFECWAYLQNTYTWLWTDEGASGGGGLSIRVDWSGTRTLDVRCNKDSGTPKVGSSVPLSASFPFSGYFCVERKGRYVYGSFNGTVVLTIDLGSTSYALLAPAATPRFGDSPASWGAFTAHFGRVRWTLGVARYGGTNFVPPAGPYPVG